VSVTPQLQIVYILSKDGHFISPLRVQDAGISSEIKQRKYFPLTVQHILLSFNVM